MKNGKKHVVIEADAKEMLELYCKKTGIKKVKALSNMVLAYFKEWEVRLKKDERVI